jgi:hypothetical protein
LISLMASALSAPARSTLSSLTPEQREKDDITRVTRQRPILRVCSELALVGIIRDNQRKCGGEWIMKVLRELVWSYMRIHISCGSHLALALERPIIILVTPTFYIPEVLLISLPRLKAAGVKTRPRTEHDAERWAT